MNERIERLNQVALQGNIDDFYNLIKIDVKLLDHIDELSFVDTPLHKSASAGRIPFSIEMMKLKPSFVSKPNPNGHSPIHLALENGHTEMVRQLLQHDADLVRVKGRECMTPLHYIAKTDGHLALLEKFLSVCPDSITDMTTRNETALHIALKYNQLEAFKFLVGWLLREWPSWSEILKLKDVEGNTILHIAVSKNQTQAVRHLLAWGGTSFKVNKKNLEDKTALDILERQRTQGVDNSEMRDILDGAGALTASSLPAVTPPHAHYLSLPVPEVATPEKVVKIPLSDEKRNALLVVAALLVTVSYQAILSPPGGLWQDNDLSNPNTTRAGSAIARTESSIPFWLFLVFNSTIFLSAIAATFVLIPPVGLVGATLGAVSVCLYYCYFNSLIVITHASDWTVPFVALLPFTILLVVVALSFPPKGIGYLRNLRRN